MLTAFLVAFLDIANDFYNTYGQILDRVMDLIDLLNNNSSYFDQVLGIVYYFVGKNLCLTLLGFALLVFVFRLSMAFINLVGQFVP